MAGFLCKQLKHFMPATTLIPARFLREDDQNQDSPENNWCYSTGPGHQNHNQPGKAIFLKAGQHGRFQQNQEPVIS